MAVRTSIAKLDMYPCYTGRMHYGGEMLVKRAGGARCFIGYYGAIP
jgi:hypothetical protein